MSTNDNAVSKVVGAGDTLDDIDDLPAFKVWPSGAYRVTLAAGLVEKKIGEHPAVELEMTHQETMEVTEPVPEDEMPVVNDTCSTAYMMDNKVGAGALKEILKVISEKLGTKKIGELYAGCKGMQVLVTGKRTYDDKKDRHYFNVKSFTIL